MSRINPAHEKELLTDILSYAYDPEAFVFYAYPWGKPNSPLANVQPRRWQVSVLRDIGVHVKGQKLAFENDLAMEVYREVDRSGRGPGKSALLGWLANWQVSTHLGSSVIVTANTESQLRSKTFPEFSKWFTLAINSHWWHVDGMKIYPQDWFAKLAKNQLQIDPLYWTIIGQNWSEDNPDAFAGAHNAYGLFVMFDEASGIPEPIWSVTNGFFTEQNPFRFWLAFSNPRRNSGAFFNRFNRPAFAKTWKQRHINCLHVEGIDQSVNEAMIAENGKDSDVVRVEVLGEFPEASTDQLIPNSHVLGAQQREMEFIDEDAALVMGVDPAPRGRTAIRFRQGRDARSIKPVILNGADNLGIVAKVIELIERYDPDAVAVDAGLGTGVIDVLRSKKIKVEEVWMGRASEDGEGEWATVGSALWGKMRDWLPGAMIDDSPELYRDLTVRTWKWFGGREEGKKILTSKREMARDGIPSPDDGDALALTFYPRVLRRGRRVNMAGRQSTAMARDVDYDVLAG